MANHFTCDRNLNLTRHNDGHSRTYIPVVITTGTGTLLSSRTMFFFLPPVYSIMMTAITVRSTFKGLYPAHPEVNPRSLYMATYWADSALVQQFANSVPPSIFVHPAVAALLSFPHCSLVHHSDHTYTSGQLGSVAGSCLGFFPALIPCLTIAQVGETRSQKHKNRFSLYGTDSAYTLRFPPSILSLF